MNGPFGGREVHAEKRSGCTQPGRSNAAVSGLSRAGVLPGVALVLQARTVVLCPYGQPVGAGLHRHRDPSRGHHRDGLFIDHGAGVVIGETAEIGNNVTLYHGVTLGGTGKDEGKRHPTIGDNVLIGTGCKVLGPITIGANSRIGANSVVLSCIPANATAIGIPACVVRVNGSKVARSSEELNQRDYPDVVHADIKALQQRIAALECALADPQAAPAEKR